ncbi:hypothetical protein [Streptomyces sp. ICBB 8177]|uniref:hypothetical protein n=1 Tax=Streptomyces sp. ICBB 8177 TaxID=563922 RepID=UPI000D6814BC|nr:hypothetical protein [Streptomyces sp. ICBB 8177]PWI42194.1 hypothetical protein CK485_25915 [Streptomyces sp. ICBB 8177]
MRALKRQSRGDRTRSALEDEPGPAVPQAVEDGIADAEDTDEQFDTAEAAGELGDLDEESFGIFRVHCPDCARPIALLADEETLPEHALCPSPWNPFGLTVCAGSGRSVADARPVEEDEEGTEGDVAALLTLPAGLDWRTQPFSHAGGPGSRPMRLPEMRTPRA